MSKADLAVYIGRFQPFHLGHAFALQRALELAHKVLVLVGSAEAPSTIKNPWSESERIEMIRGAFPNESAAGVIKFDTLLDYPYSDTEWISQVRDAVNYNFPHAKNIILVGHEKDASSFYLQLFKDWKYVDTGFMDLGEDVEFAIDSTKIREFLFEGRPQYIKGLVPENVYPQIVASSRTPEWGELQKEYKFIKSYRKSWEAAPFPPIFVTTDVVCIASGSILMVKRGQNPGKGLWALPGGFLDQVEGIEDGAIRELIEETNIKLQPEVLKRCIKHVQVFDRRGGVSSEDRGRIITHAHVIKLDDSKELPKVRGGDDAAEAVWVPIYAVNRKNCFSDHYHIIDALRSHF